MKQNLWSAAIYGFALLIGVGVVGADWILTAPGTYLPAPGEGKSVEVFTKTVDVFSNLNGLMTNWAFAMIGAAAFLAKHIAENVTESTTKHVKLRVALLSGLFFSGVASIAFSQIGNGVLLRMLSAQQNPFENDNLWLSLRYQYYTLVFGAAALSILSLVSLVDVMLGWNDRDDKTASGSDGRIRGRKVREEGSNV